MIYGINFWFKNIQYKLIMNTNETSLNEILLNLENQYPSELFGENNEK